MFAYIANQQSVNVIANTQAITSTGATTTAVDVSNFVGPVLVTVIVPAGGTNTMTITPVHSVTNGSGYANIPAAAILSATTGLATTLSTVSTTASVQTFALNRELLRQYVAITLSGTSLAQTVTIVVSALQQYTSTSV